MLMSVILHTNQFFEAETWVLKADGAEVKLTLN